MFFLFIILSCYICTQITNSLHITYYIYMYNKKKNVFLFIIRSCHICTQIVIYKELYIHTSRDINKPVSGHIILVAGHRGTISYFTLVCDES